MWSVIPTACAEKKHKKCRGITVGAKYDAAEDSVKAISFVRSPSFAKILSSIIKAETFELRSEISMLRSKLQILEDLIVELIKMLSGSTDKNLVDNQAEHVKIQMLTGIQKSATAFASKK